MLRMALPIGAIGFGDGLPQMITLLRRFSLCLRNARAANDPILCPNSVMGVSW